MMGCRTCEALSRQVEHQQRMIDRLLEAANIRPVNPDPANIADEILREEQNEEVMLPERYGE